MARYANLTNYNAVKALGARSRIVRNPGDMDGLATLILPGVGAFGAVAEKIDALGLRADLADRIRSGRPTMAICLGLHLRGHASTENE